VTHPTSLGPGAGTSCIETSGEARLQNTFA
jgi:hypothetical protein